MYRLRIRDSVNKAFLQLAKKDPKTLQIIANKIDEILEKPERFKNLRAPLQHLKRIHISSSYVLVYSVDRDNRTVIIEDFAYHDSIYRKR